MDQLIHDGLYYEVGELIRKAILEHREVDMTPLIPFFHYVDPTILGTYYAFSGVEVPQQLRRVAEKSVELASIIAGVDLLAKARAGDISVLKDLSNLSFEQDIPRILYLKAKLLAQINDRDHALHQTYQQLSKFDEVFTEDFMRQFADLAFACGVKTGEIMHGFCMKYLSKTEEFGKFVTVATFQPIEALTIEQNGFAVEITQQEAENWQRCTAAMNYMLQQNVSERMQLPYSKCLKALNCSDERELELLITHMCIRNLLRVRIDQIDRVIRVMWVKPMVLDEQGRQTVVERLQEWESRVQQTLEVFERVCMEDEQLGLQ